MNRIGGRCDLIIRMDYMLYGDHSGGTNSYWARLSHDELQAASVGPGSLEHPTTFPLTVFLTLVAVQDLSMLPTFRVI